MAEELPEEIWLDIFDGLDEKGEQDTIAACAMVCTQWRWLLKDRYLEGRTMTFNLM